MDPWNPLIPPQGTEATQTRISRCLRAPGGALGVGRVPFPLSQLKFWISLVVLNPPELQLNFQKKTPPLSEGKSEITTEITPAQRSVFPDLAQNSGGVLISFFSQLNDAKGDPQAGLDLP